MSTGAGAGELLHAGDRPAEGPVEGERAVAARSPFQLFWRRLRRDRVALAALAFIAFLVLIALLAGPICRLVGAPGPNVQSTKALDPTFGLPTGPSSAHLFGVDELGRDVFARVLYGARVSLEVAFIGTGLAALIGVLFGTLAGYHRGWVDTGIARSIDVLLAFPVLLLGLGLATACSDRNGCAGGLLQPGIPVVIAIIVLANAPYVARIIRGQVLTLREREFVEAARALGANDALILSRHVLPHLVSPVIVAFSLDVGTKILATAGLSFLGLGTQPPTADWGSMLATGRQFVIFRPHVVLLPGLAIFVIVLALNLVGDALRDLLDPRTRAHA
jgi:ABC-type dipeptide/oligopeptide/nickel transport system permease subunit